MLDDGGLEISLILQKTLFYFAKNRSLFLSAKTCAALSCEILSVDFADVYGA